MQKKIQPSFWNFSVPDALAFTNSTENRLTDQEASITANIEHDCSA